MRGFVGEGLSMLIASLAFSLIVIMIVIMFLAPTEASGMPEAFNYFTGVFTRG